MTSFLALLLAPLASVPVPSQAPWPTVRINEVQPDPAGPDAGFEWFELAVLDPVSPGKLDGWSVVDQDGATVFDLPAGQMLLGDWTVYVVLGDVRPGVASADLASRRASVWFSGPTATERLADGTGALALRAADGTIVDFVAWGKGASPSGPVVDEAVVAGAWPAGDFVDLSFDAPAPNFPGATIGRDRWVTDTDCAADWAGNGGLHAVGATPAQRNDARVESPEGLIERAQELVVVALASYGAGPSEPGRFSVLDSSVDDVSAVDLPGPDWEVTAEHRFVVSDDGTGKVENWTGTLVARSSSCGARCTRLEIAGSIQGPTLDGLSVSWWQERSGYGGPIVYDLQDSTLALHLGGDAYTRSTSSTHQAELVGDGHVVWTGARSEQNWGNAVPLDIAFTIDVRDLSPTMRSVQSTVTQPHPSFAAPPLGSVVERDQVMITEVSTGTVSFSSPEEHTHTRTIDYYVGPTLVGRVDAADPAVEVVMRVDGAAGDVLGSFERNSTIPLRSATGTPLFDVELHTVEEVSRIGGKEKTWITSTFRRVDPDATVTVLSTEAFQVDPPVGEWTKGDVGATQTLYGGQSLASASTSHMTTQVVVPFGIAAVCYRVAASLAATALVTAGATGAGAASAWAYCELASLSWLAFQ